MEMAGHGTDKLHRVEIVVKLHYLERLPSGEATGATCMGQSGGVMRDQFLPAIMARLERIAAA